MKNKLDMVAGFLWRLNAPQAGESYRMVSWLLLRGLGLVYLSAFISFAVQASGLIGSEGVLPLADFMDVVSNNMGWEKYWQVPMVFWTIGGSNFAIHLVAWGGALFSLLLVFNVIPRISLAVLYIFYLSLFYAGQTFMTFQWDLFVLEAGILAFVLSFATKPGIWLFRFLMFRFMFMAGVVKITSGDAAWHDMSALSYHFLTQPIPTPFAWYAHHMPQSVLAFATASTLFIELAVPFMIFMGRRARFFSAYLFLALQCVILLTGNYNFFNFLTVFLCIVLFDDAALCKVLRGKWLAFVENRSSAEVTARGRVYIGVASFAAITVMISLLQASVRIGVELPRPLAWVHDTLQPLRVVSTYGPFAVMTKKRMEIVVEGSDDGENWKEYGFKYKPGEVSRPLSWNVPHQPRLDWQMWFAALGDVNGNPWFVRMIQKILEGSLDVLELLENNPFPEKPPVYIRALFYDYTFTNADERAGSGAMWKRELKGFYLPPAKLNAPVIIKSED